EQVEVRPDEWEYPDGPWTLVVSNAALWSSRASPWNEDWDALGPADFQVARRSIEVEREAAWSLEDAFRLVVRHARHPRPEYGVDEKGPRVELGTRSIRDGESYEFDADGYYGTSHSPSAGP